MMLKLLLIAIAACVVSSTVPTTERIGSEFRGSITIMKLGTKKSTSPPCIPEKAPSQHIYDTEKECVDNCLDYCGSAMKCNATCVLKLRCVCATNKYCIIDQQPDGTYGPSCWDFDNVIS